MLKTFKSPFALYATPTWFETLHNIDPSNYILGISETEEGQVQSIIPIEIKSKELIFSIHRKDIFKYKFNCAYVLGGEPLGIISSEEYDELFKKLINSKRNLSAISFKCIRESSPFSKKLTDIIKIENVFLNETQMQQISILSPNANISLIENNNVIEKKK